MFADLLRNRVKKAGQPPGTAIYTGEEERGEPTITVVTYSTDNVQKAVGRNFDVCLSETKLKASDSVTWVNVEGLKDTSLIEKIAQAYHLHPLTVEDILNVEQRPKLEEFDEYYFMILRLLVWQPAEKTFSVEQISVVFGKDFVLSFEEKGFHVFDTIRERLCNPHIQRVRQHGPDYLAYRLIDTVVDQYFIVLEQISENIEEVEEEIMTNPAQEQSRTLYHLKRQVLTVRKVIWPMREALSHLLQCDNELVSAFTRTYIRDVYDHTAQAIDALESFRDALSSMLDVYLSSLTNRMNEVMKVLTIIATIFIPMTFIASIYGMNFDYMPELHSHWGYFAVLGLMFLIASSMLGYFWRKKWL